MTTIIFKSAALAFTFLVLFLIASAEVFAAAAPMSISQLALYQGADREKILIEGAKREGQVAFYNSHTWFRTFVRDFEKRYPFVKVAEWRNDSKNIIRRVMEEFKAGRFLVDVIETTPEVMGLLKRDGVFSEFYTPEARNYPDDVKAKGKSGLYYLGDRKTYNSLGFNTSLVPPSEAPKTMKDLLNPKWKGKMAIAGIHRRALDRQCIGNSGTRVSR